MRFQNYLNDSYIGIIDKDQNMPQLCKKDRKINNLLKELNNYLDLHISQKDIKFGIVQEYKSPTEKLQNVDNMKLEKLTRKWMKLSEEFEEIKEQHLDKLNKL